ncbi:hypothetical protein [Nocardioides sp.]|uniref:hypothetical protein n=1 Tax=Nocardioides sp. TaxID=35761 RepID=UPI002B897EF9|nr:hypothetical protein [Nocardioides sp.]HXH79500.1 hypothetical protein [Nocardioides sp.]
MPTDTTRTGPVRLEATAEGWTLPRTGWADGPPDQVSVVTLWYDPDGSLITSEDRIAALEAQHKEAAHGDA